MHSCIHVKIFISITQRLLLSSEVSELWNYMLKLRVYCEGNIYDFLVIWREFGSASFRFRSCPTSIQWCYCVLSVIRFHSILISGYVCTSPISAPRGSLVCKHVARRCWSTLPQLLLQRDNDPGLRPVCIVWIGGGAEHASLATALLPFMALHWVAATGQHSLVLSRKTQVTWWHFNPERCCISGKFLYLYHSRDMPKFEYLFRWSGWR